MDEFNIEKQTQELTDATVQSIKKLFPIKTNDRELKLNRVWVEDNLDPQDYKSQYKMKVADRTWAIPVYASFDLKDKKGKVIQKNAKVKIANLPKPTPRASYIVNGSEVQISKQLRLRPAGYVVKTQAGSFKGQINLSKGYAGQIEVNMDPKSGIFSAKTGQGNQKLYPILNALGISDAELAKRWGSDVLQANKSISKAVFDNSIKNFARSMTGRSYKDVQNASEDLRNYIKETAMDPKVNKRTLGKAHDKMDSFFLADTAARLLNTFRGNVEPHDRNSLEFKEFRTVADLIQERFDVKRNRRAIENKLKTNVEHRDSIQDIVNPAVIGPHITAVFNLSELSQRPSQLNPVDMLNTATTATIMGAGGITSPHAITEDMRSVHPSHMGFLDPVHTPECFDQLTEVFTSDGWKFWSEVTEDDLFACNIEGSLVFKKADRLINEEYKGLMYGIKAGEIAYLVTPNHRVWSRPSGKDKTSEWQFHTPEDIHNKPRVFQCSHMPYIGNEFGMSFSSTEDWIDFIEGDLSDENIFIPKDLFHAPIKIRENLLHSLMKNGRTVYMKSGETVYMKEVFTTTSERLANDFERLAIGLGKAVSHKTDSEFIHRIRFLKHSEQSANEHTDYYSLQEYNGRVYCATVPGGLLFVRRKGSVGIWSGNSSNVGIVYHLPAGVSAKDRTLRTRAINVKTGKLERIDPATFADHVIAFPGQYDSKKKTWRDPKNVVVLGQKNKTKTVSAKDVDYILQNPKQLFSISSNLIPYLPTNSGGRTLVASKLAEQAVSLVDAEAPLVQSKLGQETFESVLGDAFSSKAPVDGRISRVSKDKITITDKKGKKHTIPLYDDFPLNKESFIKSTAKVKTGDEVKAGDVIADTNFTRDGKLSLGKNLRTAYLNYKGYNFEDAIVITEDAAQKLTSEHMYEESAEPDDRHLISKDKFAAYYPTAYTKDQLEKLDKDGVVKKGTLLQPGDPIITQLRKDEVDPENLIFGKLSRTLVRPWKDASSKWDKDMPGEVVKVDRHGGKVKVFIKAREAAQPGDKLVGRYGNKGIIGKIIPTEDAPKDKDGNPVDIIMNPHGIVTRINVGQLLENAASKVAEKTGQPVAVDNFSGENYTQSTKDLLAKHGVSATEELFDPLTNKSLGDITVGKSYFFKLDKQARSQFSARGAGPGWKYSQNTLEPIKGGEEGAKALDLLTFYSMLGHGARSNLREMSTTKASRNDEFWTALKLGMTLPPPKPTFSYNKFINYMKAAGVNVKQEGTKQVLAPMTDREVERLSNGEIKDFQFVRAKDLTEIKGGLMDKQVTGGVRGEKWSHIKLSEPIVNPIFEKPVRTLLDLDKRTYEDIIEGRRYVDKEGHFTEEPGGMTGGAAFKAMLSKIDLDKARKDFQKKIKQSKNPTAINKANAGLRYVEALKKFKLKPQEAYIMSKVPVLPPVYRPIYALPDGNLNTSGLNYLYRDLGLVNQKLQWMNDKPYMPEETKSSLRRDIYKGLAAVAGIENPLVFYPDSRPIQGIIKELKGSEEKGSKSGFFQRHVIRKEQDLVGRGTIMPEPKLGVDEAGIPENMAWTIFQPFVMRELIHQGYKPTEADKQIKQKSYLAQKALDAVMAERPVILNRAPTLHKFGVLSFKPKRVEGNAIKIPPLITKGFGADFDGDDQINQVLICVDKEKFKDDIRVIRALEIRRYPMTARFKEAVGYTDEDGEFFLCNLEDFPHGEKIGEKNHISFYNVPDGIKVVAINETTGCSCLANVAGWSHHRQRFVEIVTLGSGRQIITDDDERAVYGVDANSLKWCRRRPSEAQNQFVPVLEKVDAPKESINTIELNHRTFKKDPRLNRVIKLTRELGYFFGAMVGNGWVSHHNGDEKAINFASNNANVQEAWFESAKLFFNEQPTLEKAFSDKQKSANSIVSTDLAEFIEPLIGKGEDNKHLPPFFMAAPKEFRQGILDGLLDTNGSPSWSNAKNTPQFICTYSSDSLRLEQEIQQMLRLFKISSKITESKTPEGKRCWMLNISSVDLYAYRKFTLANSSKESKIDEFLSGPAPNSTMAYSRYRLVPVPKALASDLQKKIDRKAHRGLYAAISDAKRRNYMSKIAAQKFVKAIGSSCNHPLYADWVSLVQMPHVHFERVKSSEKTSLREDGYDLTVPGHETFMSIDGVILSNTMTVHVPVMPEAVKESWNMMPSKHLYNPGSGKVMMLPSQESALGLYLLTRDGKPVDKTFNKIDELSQAIDNGELGINDLVTLAGKKTTYGHALIDSVLPKEYRFQNMLLDKKGINALMSDIAKNKPKEYAKTVDRLTELGNQYAFSTGATVTIDDIQPEIPQKDDVLAAAREKAKHMSDEQKVKLYQSVDTKLKGLINKNLQGNNLYEMVKSGARGNIDQLKQIVSAPLLVENVDGKPLPIPIEGSFAHGLSPWDYWNSMYGARRGVVDKQLQTQKPGEFNKDIMATAVKMVVQKKDCGTQEGMTFKLDERDAQDRVLSEDIIANGQTLARRGDILDANLVNKLRDNKVKNVKARSPLTCKIPKGICSKCYGYTHEGDLPRPGENVGAISGQAMSEPLTQMVLSSMHSGGVAGAQNMTGYEKIDKLIHMPKIIHGSATLAEHGGKVSAIKKAPAGGNLVWVNDTQHHVSSATPLKVKTGQSVKKGDPLSDGIIQPRELVRLKGMRPAQEYIVDEVVKAYRDTGTDLLKRNVETVVRAMADTTEIAEPGDSGLMTGDITSYSFVENFNSEALGNVPLNEAIGKKLHKKTGPYKKGTVVDEKVAKVLEGMNVGSVPIGPNPIKHAPFVDGIRNVPMFSKDWMSHMAYGHIAKNVIEGAGEAWTSDLHDYAPVPAFAYGAEFGKGKEGRY